MSSPSSLILELSCAELGQTPVAELLREHLAVRFAQVFSAETCRALTTAVYAARPFWNSDFGGAQFSLGRAWYAHFEEKRARLYFTRARESDQLVERFLPKMQSRIRALMSQAIGEPVQSRAGWCGAGVHIFPAKGWCAQHGGDIHFDTEGLLYPEPLAHTTALTMILMLQPPEQGGGLKIWRARYAGSDAITPQMLAADSEIARYETGDLVVIDAYALHQIQPFEGARDRISITAHLAKTPKGWVIWF